MRPAEHAAGAGKGSGPGPRGPGNAPTGVSRECQPLAPARTGACSGRGARGAGLGRLWGISRGRGSEPADVVSQRRGGQEPRRPGAEVGTPARVRRARGTVLGSVRPGARSGDLRTRGPANLGAPPRSIGWNQSQRPCPGTLFGLS